MIEFIIGILAFLMCLLTYTLYRISRRLSYFVSNLEETFQSIESYREHLEFSVQASRIRVFVLARAKRNEMKVAFGQPGLATI